MRFRPGEDIEFQLSRMLNEGLELDDNMRGSLVEVVLSGGEMAFEHGLGYTPVGFILLAKEGPGDVWAARLRDWNSRIIYFGSDASNLMVRLFVM